MFGSQKTPFVSSVPSCCRAAPTKHVVCVCVWGKKGIKSRKISKLTSCKSLSFFGGNFTRNHTFWRHLHVVGVHVFSVPEEEKEKIKNEAKSQHHLSGPGDIKNPPWQGDPLLCRLMLHRSGQISCSGTHGGDAGTLLISTSISVCTGNWETVFASYFNSLQMAKLPSACWMGKKKSRDAVDCTTASIWILHLSHWFNTDEWRRTKRTEAPDAHRHSQHSRQRIVGLVRPSFEGKDVDNSEFNHSFMLDRDITACSDRANGAHWLDLYQGLCSRTTGQNTRPSVSGRLLQALC